MMDRIRKFQILNNQIFSILEKYLKSNKDQEPIVIDIAPPTPDIVEDETAQSKRPMSVMLEGGHVTGSEVWNTYTFWSALGKVLYTAGVYFLGQFH